MTAGENKHRCADFCRPRGLLEACLLLLMREAPAHGYELRARLARFGFEGQDPGAVYRALHRLSGEGLAHANWQESDRTGHGRQVYAITREGEDVLGQTRDAVADLVRTLCLFLAEHDGGKAAADAADLEGTYVSEDGATERTVGVRALMTAERAS
ncbi:PadR family transcriptional regulator [Haloechinothrix salitolerans]|uniref:PadR family transcriptional regulator n=1 Tax=Haloechinothrix salitolerans TaxID=926830 RepID=A0ABW2C478_9PSEU